MPFMLDSDTLLVVRPIPGVMGDVVIPNHLYDGTIAADNVVRAHATRRRFASHACLPDLRCGQGASVVHRAGDFNTKIGPILRRDGAIVRSLQGPGLGDQQACYGGEQTTGGRDQGTRDDPVLSPLGGEGRPSPGLSLRGRRGGRGGAGGRYCTAPLPCGRGSVGGLGAASLRSRFCLAALAPLPYGRGSVGGLVAASLRARFCLAALRRFLAGAVLFGGLGAAAVMAGPPTARAEISAAAARCQR